MKPYIKIVDNDGTFQPHGFQACFDEVWEKIEEIEQKIAKMHKIVEKLDNLLETKKNKWTL